MTLIKPLLTWIAPPLLLVLGVLALLGACAPMATLNALSPRASHRLAEGVPYGPLARHRVDIYTPAAAAPAAGYPLVLFFYGGSWNRGERIDYRFIGAALAARGVLALVADYRLFPQVRYPQFLDDCALAAGYALEQTTRLGGDPRRVFVMGHSAGAYNAAMLALDPRWLGSVGHAPAELAGWIGLAGPYDFQPMRNVDAQPVFFHPHYPAGSQPVDHAGHASPPAFLGAARGDDTVDPQRNSVGLSVRLQRAGIPVTLKLYERVDHVTLAAAFAWPLRWLAPVLDDVLAFVQAPTAPRRAPADPL